MVSLKKYLVHSFIFVGFLLSSISFASSAVISDSLGYDTIFKCRLNCSSGTCELIESTGKYLCRADFEIENCNKGDVQYKPSGLCGTTSRTCCGGLDGWSDWGKECPKTCDRSTKPITSRDCGTKGTQTRTVTCDTSTGDWIEGAWGLCVERVCDLNETRQCPSNKNKVQYCLSDGTGWSTSCSCENEGNGTVYCQGMRLTTAQGNTCMHGIWSSETCSGICCCAQDTPKLMSNGYPGCWGTRTDHKGFTHSSWQYACVCQRPSSGGGGLMPNPDF